MELFLDSAVIRDAEIASQWGWVKGITTNPVLLAKSDRTPSETLRALANLTSGPVFYQLTATDLKGMLAEADMAHLLLGRQLVVKIPAVKIGFEAASRLSPYIPICVTGIYHAAQAMVAQAAGARYAVIYFHRAMTLLDDGLRLAREMVTALQGTETTVLAASIKSLDEVIAIRQAGITSMTMPLAMLEAMTTQPISEETWQEFTQNGIGLPADASRAMMGGSH